MIRPRPGQIILISVVATTLASILIAGSGKTAFIESYNIEASKDLEQYASYFRIDLETAATQLFLQELAGNLEAELSKYEEDIFGGLFIQHTPEFRVIVQFTKDGSEILKPYIENNPLADVIDVKQYSIH